MQPDTSPQKVRLPQSLLYPVEITELLQSQGSKVKKHTPLLKYKYWNRVPDGVPEDGTPPAMVTKEFYADFESPFDGSVAKCNVGVGERVCDHTTVVLEILEECDHSVQYGGLCAICGADLDDKDYLGYNDTDRAPIAMSHDTNGLTVSLAEAQRIEKTATDRLLKARKLILVVDLDQTVIHTAIDPKVGQWIQDENHYNHLAVKDVRSFTIAEPLSMGQKDVWYYVKLRPGLHEFLEKMAKCFEMHIYTMATKRYALETAKLIDPTGKYFADRILSREDSGSMWRKDLTRLFPVTTALVTVIDDRGDIWRWSPHLVRVFPYTFFQETDDINSGFLPKRSGLVVPDQSEDGKMADHALTDNDIELNHLARNLIKVHESFYSHYDVDKKVPDVGTLLPLLKTPVFRDCVMLFSGILPLGTALDSADIVAWVRSFGAVVVAELLPQVTHVIASSAGTLKVRKAAGQGKKIVRTSWIFACLEDWKRVPEEGHEIEVPNPLANEEEPMNVSERDLELPPEEGEKLMRALSGGDVDWSTVNEELREFMSSGDDDESVIGSSESESSKEPEPQETEPNGTKHSQESAAGSPAKRLKRMQQEDGDDELAAELERELSA